MREPFFKDCGTDQLMAAMKHFADGERPPHFSTVRAYLRQHHFWHIHERNVLWYWHRRHVEKTYPAAYDVVLQLAFDNTEWMPLRHNIRKRGLYPTHHQIRLSIEEIQRGVQERCDAFMADMIREAWNSGFKDHEVQQLQREVSQSQAIMLRQAPHLTIVQVLDVWDYCRKHRLAPFPGPVGATL